MKTWIKNAGLLLSALLFCASAGPKTFDIQLSSGYSAVAELKEKAAVLLAEGKITREEATEALEQAIQSRLELDNAKTMHAKEPDSAYMRLKATLEKLKKYGDELSKKGKR